VRAFTPLLQVLPAMQQHAVAEIPPTVSSAEVVESLDGLIDQVHADPSFW